MTAKILLVDDSGLARRGARQMLEAAGYEVAEAEDGLAALERTSSRSRISSCSIS